jgi:hypothetical protein
MAEEFFVLFVAHACIYQYAVVAVLYEQATHGPGTHIFIIGRVYLVPHRLRYYPKHGTAIELEVSGIDSM